MHATQTKTDYKQLLSRLCHLVALSEAKKIEGVVDSLMTSVIEIDPAHPACDRAKVDEALKVYFGVELDTKDIESSISRLFSAGTIIRGTEKGTFTLSPAGRAAQSKRVEDAKKLEDLVREQWLALVKDEFEPWTEQIATELWASLKEYLTRLFRRHGAQTALVASGRPMADTELETSSSQLLGEALDEECKTMDKEKAGRVIQRFLRDQTPERAQYIAQLLDGTFSFYALFTDDATQNYLKSTIPKITVLLDTNFLFGVLNLHDNPQNQVSLELVTLVRQQKLPFELYYHEESLREMQQTIAQAEKDLRKHEWSPALSRAVLETRAYLLNGLQLKFHEENAETQIDPSAFFLKFRHLDKLLNDQGFKIYRTPDRRILDENGEEKLDEATLQLISKYKRFLEERMPWKQKGFNTVKHDIIVWRATKALRKTGSSGLDVGALMLSADQRLFAFDWGVLSSGHGVGVVVLPSQLLQLLRPFVPRTPDFDKKFAEVFALPEFRAGGSDFSQITHRVLGFLATIKGLSEETAAGILADEFLLKKLKGIETDSEIQSAIESEVLKKNAELSSQHRDISAKLQSAQAEVVEKQGLLEAAQRGASHHERTAQERSDALEQEKREKEQLATSAKITDEKMQQTTDQLVTAKAKNAELRGVLQQTTGRVSELESEITAMKRAKERTRKIWRCIGGLLFTLIGWAVVLFLPAIRTWAWLQSHPHKLSLYLAALIVIPGLAWGIFAWKGRAWAFAAIVLAVIIRLIGVL